MKKVLILGVMAMSLLACNQTNPLLEQPNTPFGVPAFDKVKIEHYLPAFEEAIRQNKAEIDAIVNNEDAPTFENTIVALDRSGLLLDRVTGVFFNVLEADGNDEMNAIASSIIGGTLLTGGVGNVIGTLFGVLINGTISALVKSNGKLNSSWPNIITAVLLCFFIVLQAIFAKIKEKQ